MTQTAKTWKSSRAARRLIRAVVKRAGSQRAAARLLGLPTQAQLSKMLRGEIADTPAMKAALARADARAKRAWSMVRADNGSPGVDGEVALAGVERLERELAVLKDILKAKCSHVGPK